LAEKIFAVPACRVPLRHIILPGTQARAGVPDDDFETECGTARHSIFLRNRENYQGL
jgi:hypothetical protein